MWQPLGVIAFQWCCHIFNDVIMFFVVSSSLCCVGVLMFVSLSIGERCEWKELWRQGGEEIFLCKAKREAFLWRALFLDFFFFFVCFLFIITTMFCVSFVSFYWRECY